MEVDAGGTQRLVAAGRESGVRRVVYLSGAGAGHDAQRHWFRAKAVAEDAVRDSGMAWTILRPTWVYGPGRRLPQSLPRLRPNACPSCP